MWIEIAGELINFSRIIKVTKTDSNNEYNIRFYTTSTDYLEYKFKNQKEIQVAYFNVLEFLKSKPADGFVE